METNEWLTLAQAGIKNGKNQRYFANLRNRNPHYFEGIELKKVGGSYVIKESDIEIVLSRVKKWGVRLVVTPTKWTKKANCDFAF